MQSKRDMSLVFWALALSLLAGTAEAHPRSSLSLAGPPVRMRVIAPSAAGPWLLRIDNEAPEAIRLVADARLLTLRIQAPATGKGKAPHAVCNGPRRFGLSKAFDASRALILEAGHSYVQQFDPRLICFGKKAALIRPGSEVKATLGWKPQRVRRGRMQRAPFIVDATKRPRKYRPLRRLQAPSILLSHAKPVAFGPVIRSGKANAQPMQAGSAEEASQYRPRGAKAAASVQSKDELGAALTLTASRHVDAGHARDAVVGVQAHNTGDRAVLVALRARQLAFEVTGPSGYTRCRNRSQAHRVPRDLFRRLAHGAHIHMRVRLAEVCPLGTFDRPGLYIVRPSLHVDASGAEYGIRAATGVVTPRDPGEVGGTHKQDDDATVLRIRHGSQPFYRFAPRAIPTRALP